MGGGAPLTVVSIRTPSECFRQATKLVVEAPVPGECGRPRKAVQPLTNRVTDILNCPLKDYIGKLDSYNVSSSVAWYRVSSRHTAIGFPHVPPF